jgi:hypothetical protein
MQGIIKASSNKGKGYLIVIGEDGKTYCAPSLSDKHLLLQMSHYCSFRCGKAVTFDLAESNNRNSNVICNVDLVEPDPEILSGREESTIVYWPRPTGEWFGFAKRPCGCSIFVGELAFRDKEGICDIGVGTRITHGIGLTKDGTRWLATNAEIIQAMDLQSSESGVESQE